MMRQEKNRKLLFDRRDGFNFHQPAVRIAEPLRNEDCSTANLRTRQTGRAFESPSTIGIMCKRAREKFKGLEGFHFHQLRHTFTREAKRTSARLIDKVVGEA